MIMIKNIQMVKFIFLKGLYMAHWTEEKEIGKRWKALFSVFVYKILGRTFIILYLIPISIVYFFYSKTRMQASREYLKKMSQKLECRLPENI